MEQKRHVSNQIYRTVASALGTELLRQEQEAITGKTVSKQTIKRYLTGYGEYQAIPQPALTAALNLFAVSVELTRVINSFALNQYKKKK